MEALATSAAHGKIATEEVRRSALLTLDPDLGNELPPRLWRSLQTRAQVQVVPFPAGSWEPSRLLATSSLLLIEGLLVREVQVAGRFSAELFGAGHIIHLPDPEDASALPRGRWTALLAGRVALLDQRLLAEVSRSLPLLTSITSRSIQRGRLLGVLALTRTMRRTDERLMFLLALFASRWGRIRPDGVRLTLPVSHELLGHLIGRRRQSVTSALGELRALGLIRELPNGDWLLANQIYETGQHQGVPASTPSCEREVLLLDIDPELAARVPPDQISAARARSRVRIRTVAPGRWEPYAEYRAPVSWLGLLIVGGFLARRSSYRPGSGADEPRGGADDRSQSDACLRDPCLRDENAIEILGPGDLIRPWDDEPQPLANVLTDWRALAPTTLALLDDELARRLSRWPELTAELLVRASRRARWTAARLAVSQHSPAATRVLYLFCRLATRWGKRASGGVRLTLPLTHAQIGQLIGMRRPSVTLALGELRRAGQLTRLEDGAWLIDEGAARHTLDICEPACL